MAEKRVRANLPVLGLARDEETTVEVTPYLQAVIDRGYMSVVEDGAVAGEPAAAEGSRTGGTAG